MQKAETFLWFLEKGRSKIQSMRRVQWAIADWKMEGPIGKECEWSLVAESSPQLTAFKEHNRKELNFAHKKQEPRSGLFSGSSRQTRLAPGFRLVVPSAENPVTSAEP